MKVKEWLMIKGMDFDNVRLKSLLNVEIDEDVNSYNMDFDNYLERLHSETTFKHKYLFSYIITSNKYCIGFNENPSGYSTPVCKLQK